MRNISYVCFSSPPLCASAFQIFRRIGLRDDVGERGRDLRKVKAESERGGGGGEHALAVEQFAGKSPEQQPERERGHGEKCGSAQAAGERGGELCIAHRPRRGGVQRAAHVEIFHGEKEQAREILGVNPREPLASAADARAEAEAEKREHHAQRAAAFPEHETDACADGAADRFRGTRRIAEAIRTASHAPDVFVSASAIGFYGDCGEAEITEDSPPGAGFLAETCREWEADALAAEPVCRTVRARIGLVLGKHGGALHMMLPLFRLGLGGRLGSGRQWMSWIHAEDLASLLLFAVENLDVRGALNATAPWPVRNAEFTAMLARSLRRPAFLAVPAFALRLLLREFSRELIESKRVLPAAATAQGFGFHFPQIAPALADIVA